MTFLEALRADIKAKLGDSPESITIMTTQGSEMSEFLLWNRPNLPELLGIEEVRVLITGELDPDVLVWSNSQRWKKVFREIVK
jgi:hypothetical protein